MPSQRNRRQEYENITKYYELQLLELSRLYGLIVRASDYSIVYELYINVFFGYRWYHEYHNQDDVSLARAGNLYIGNIEMLAVPIGNTNLLQLAKVWTEVSDRSSGKIALIVSRARFTLPFMWRCCKSCVDNLVRAPRAAFLPKVSYGRVRISSEMYKWIDTLQHLYKRAERSFNNGPL